MPLGRLPIIDAECERIAGRRARAFRPATGKCVKTPAIVARKRAFEGI
jgi:hypothetical protein